MAYLSNTQNDETLSSILVMLEQLVNPITTDPSSGRVRVVLDPLGGAQTLGTVTTVGTVTTCSTVTTVATVTTVSTVTSLSQIAGIPATTLIYDQMHNAWANAVRVAIT